MRSYLLDAVAGGLSKCAPGKVRRTLVDSFTATLSMPERQKEIFRTLRRHQPFPEAFFNLQTKQSLQESALRHLFTVDEAKVETLLPQAEPDVRETLTTWMISQARSAKKYDRALALLSRTSSKDWFWGGYPYHEAIQLMLALPPERDKDKQEIFRLAMAADREQHSMVLGSGDHDFAGMILAFWRHISPALALEAIHQVIDAAHFVGPDMPGFSNEHDYRVFELLPVLRQLDNDDAESLVQGSQEVQFKLKQFPNGDPPFDPTAGDTLSTEDEPAHSVRPSTAGSRVSILQGTDPRVQEIIRMADDNPRQAIAAAASLPESDRAQFWPFESPRAEAYLGIARALMKKNPSAAKDALEAVAESLKPASHPYHLVDEWLDAIEIAREMDEPDLALTLFRSGMEQADKVRSDDADPDDLNEAPKAWWPSVSAYWRLVVAAFDLSPKTVLERVREIEDPEIFLLVEVQLANKRLGAPADARDHQYGPVVVHNKKSW